MDERFLLVMFDGLRPDLVRPDTTPNLLRLAAMGTRFARARSVFPSETRVCSASVTTGCQPRRHGLVANRLAHPADMQVRGPTGRSVNTGQAEDLRALEQEIGEKLLDMPSLGARLAAAGHDFAVLSSGTSGQSHVLNPTAAELGQVTLSVHGAQSCSPRGADLLASLSPPPADGPGRAEWIAEAFRTRLLPNPPAATILWLCEPDTSAHYTGLGSPANLAALRRADAAFGRILDDWQAGPMRDRLHIMAASDHGHATITGSVSVAPLFAAEPRFADCRLLPGASGGVVVPCGEAAVITEVAAWLARQDWIGHVFAADGADLPPAVLPRSAVLADHRRTAHVLYTLRAGPAPSPLGLPGVTLNDGALPIGGGTHGGLTAAEMSVVMIMAGLRTPRGELSEWPASLVDIAPTALALLGLPGGDMLDGRALVEALTPGASPTDTPAPETWEAANGLYRQRLSRTRLGRQVYIDQAQRE
ncbi:MAG: alkaline phosphatase family protein [Acetobacteraceae bacterium]|nr:alkaline phosphatase family protein [Acetobacteraceae bacterium]